MTLQEKYNLPPEEELRIFGVVGEPAVAINRDVNYGNFIKRFSGQDVGLNFDNFNYRPFNWVVYNKDRTAIHMAIVSRDNWKTAEVQVTKEFEEYCAKHRSSYIKEFVTKAAQVLKTRLYNNQYNLVRSFVPNATRSSDIYNYSNFHCSDISNIRFIEFRVVNSIGQPPKPLPTIKFKSLEDIARFNDTVKNFYLKVENKVQPAKIEVVEMDEADFRVLSSLGQGTVEQPSAPMVYDARWNEEHQCYYNSEGEMVDEYGDHILDDDDEIILRSDREEVVAVSEEETQPVQQEAQINDEISW